MHLLASTANSVCVCGGVSRVAQRQPGSVQVQNHQEICTAVSQGHMACFCFSKLFSEAKTRNFSSWHSSVAGGGITVAHLVSSA